MYTVYRKLENGEFLHLASRDELEEAVQLVKAFKVHWPAEYVVRDSQGNDIHFTE